MHGRGRNEYRKAHPLEELSERIQEHASNHRAAAKKVLELEAVARVHDLDESKQRELASARRNATIQLRKVARHYRQNQSDYRIVARQEMNSSTNQDVHTTK